MLLLTANRQPSRSLRSRRTSARRSARSSPGWPRLNLLPVEMTWEAQEGFENVEDNKKVTAVDANDSPTTRAWMQGKGSKIFPDKKNPTDTTPNRNRCVLHIKSAPNFTVYLKTFDVDDATPDSVDNDPAHKLDPNNQAGDDNMDTVWTRTGKFISSGGPTATVTLDASGEAKMIFETTKQPGDNFRVALAFKQEDLNVAQVNNPSGSGFIAGDSDKQPTGFNGVASPMLTVWRRLWCEFDSMGAPPQTGNQRNFDEGTVYAVLSANQVKVSQLSDEINRFQNGWIDIDGVGGFKVVGNSKGVGWDIVTVEGNIGAEALQHHFTIYDDDSLPLGTRAPRTLPYQISGGSLIYTAYADAFIEPIKVPSQYVQNDVAFEKNLNVWDYFFDWAPAVLAHRDLDDSEEFWYVYVLCAWQPNLGVDRDPDDEVAVTGQTDPLVVGARNMSAIYIETIRETESLPFDPRTEEYHTVVHEIGHQGGGKHSDLGIMVEGALSSENQFKPITIKRFRENRRF